MAESRFLARLARVARWTGIGFAGLLVLLTVTGLGGFFYLRSSLPQLEGEIAVEGLDRPVEILRDAQGIPTIRAESLTDAYAALGFLHAQDRLAQMEFMRRAAAGRLSEIAGERTLGIDRFMRALNLRGLAEGNLAYLTPEARQSLEAYAEGVNAYLSSHGGAWPPEFVLSRNRPEPWSAADSLSWGRLMALRLSGNWRREITYARAAQRLTTEQMRTIWPEEAENGPASLGGDLRGFADLGHQIEGLAQALPDWLEPTTASNAWVVGGEHTESGLPLLANDPHLQLDEPAVWYLIRIETPEGLRVGATTPGVPFLVIGHNGDLAWGFTTTHSDTQDLFIEKIDPLDSGCYLTPDGSAAFTLREEEIAIRGREPETATFRATRHGPVLSDVLPDAGSIASEDQVIALAWSALAPDDGSAQALFDLTSASSVEEAIQALEGFDSPQQNIFLADRDGAIALFSPARVPLRAEGDGRAPVPGESGRYDWTGEIPAEELPLSLAPASGFLANANNRLVDEGYPHLLTRDWQPPHRMRRILELFDEMPRPLGPDEMARIQLDLHSSYAERLLPLMLDAAKDAGGMSARVHALLSDWDLVMDRRRPEPLIYTAWVDALNRRLLASPLGAAFEDFARPDPQVLERILVHDQAAWCNAGTCGGAVVQALEDAVGELEEAFGEDMAAWRWGRAHRADFPNALLSNLPLLSRLFGYGLETDGGEATLNRGSSRFVGAVEQRYRHVHGPGLRVIYDLSELESSRFALAGGQSGNPFSPWFGSLAEDWRDGRYLTLSGGEGEGMKRLVLTPLSR